MTETGGLLYLKEHTSCYHYSKCILEGFLYHKFQVGEVTEGEAEKNSILFVMEGNLEVFCNGDSLPLSAGNMIFFQKGSMYKIHSPEKSSIVVALFENTIQSCEKMALAQLYSCVDVCGINNIYTLEIKYSLRLFLELLVIYLEDGANCVHFHEIKLKELFWILRFYYTKKEQATFFHALLGHNYEFKRLVLENYRKTRTIKELAGICGFSLSSFKRHFIKEFGEPAGQWLQKQTNSIIKFQLADGDKSIGEIADELNFSSLPQFCRYCKKICGYSPGEWRNLLKRNNKKPNDN